MAEVSSTEKNKQVFESEEDLAVDLAEYVAHLSDQFAKTRGAFTVVLSGGFSYQVSQPDSNMYALSAEGAADDYETCLKHLVKNRTIELSEINGFPKFDLMLLGMGPDGHVASLFHGHPLVKENKKWVTFIKDSPKPPLERITLTFPVINSSAHIALVVAGAGKADAVRSALGSDQGTDLLPVQIVSPEGKLNWFLDKGAASKRAHLPITTSVDLAW